MSRANIGIVGCGQIAQSVHIPLLGRIPEAQIVAVAEPDTSRRTHALQSISKTTGGSPTGYDALTAMLKHDGLDTVVICSPTAHHAADAIIAFEAGKHVYIEKPLATDMGDGRRVLDAWQQAQTIGMMGFNYRYNAIFQSLRRQIESGAVGDVVAVRTTFSTARHEVPAWKQERSNGGGVLLDLASHHIDLIRYVFSQEIIKTNAQLESRFSQDDSATLQLRLENGVLVQSFFSLCAVEEDRIEVYGTSGKLIADRYLALDVEVVPPRLSRTTRLQATMKRCSQFSKWPYLATKLRSPLHEPSYALALQAFVGAIRDGAVPAGAANIQDGLACLEVVVAAEEAASTGSNVALQPQSLATE